MLAQQRGHFRGCCNPYPRNFTADSGAFTHHVKSDVAPDIFPWQRCTIHPDRAMIIKIIGQRARVGSLTGEAETIPICRYWMSH